MEEFSIREAKPKDKQAVLDCHQNVYDGLDYLPEFYDYFMTANKSFRIITRRENSKYLLLCCIYANAFLCGFVPKKCIRTRQKRFILRSTFCRVLYKTNLNQLLLFVSDMQK